MRTVDTDVIVLSLCSVGQLHFPIETRSEHIDLSLRLFVRFRGSETLDIGKIDLGRRRIGTGEMGGCPDDTGGGERGIGVCHKR